MTQVHDEFSGALWAFKRDVRIAWRQRVDVLHVPIFFALLASLFPLAVSPEPKLLQAIAPGIVWIASLLAILLAAPRLLAYDHVDGTLEQILTLPAPLPAMMAGKLLALWVTSALPIVLLSPLVGLGFGLPVSTMPNLVSGLLLGTLSVTCLIAVGSALSLGLRSGGGLLALLTLPLCVPVVVFATGALMSAQSGLSTEAHFSLLAAFALLCVVGAPFAIAAALRLAMD